MSFSTYLELTQAVRDIQRRQSWNRELTLTRGILRVLTTSDLPATKSEPTIAYVTAGPELYLLDSNGQTLIAMAGTDHGILGGLSDDDHSIYALLAGRSGGQTLQGGTASGEDFTLRGNSNGVNGSIFLGSSIRFELVETTGQLKLPSEGSTAGLIIGGDTQLYRYASNTLALASGDTFAIDDNRFTLALAASNPTITFDTNDSLTYNRSSNYYSWGIGSTEYMRLNGTKLDLLNSAYLDANDVQLPRIGSPTYTHLEHVNNLFHSTGWFSGGVITDAGSATINVSAGTGAMRSSPSTVAQLLFFDWSSVSGQAITANNIRYVGVEYNDGSPQVVIRETDNFNDLTAFILGTVVNESGTLHIQNAPWKIGDHASAMIQRSRGTSPIARDKVVGGLIFSESGTRNVVVSIGALWHGLTSFTISAIDTDPGGAAATFDTYSAGGQEATGVAAWPNEQYDSSGTLTNMGSSKWANLWWYLELDGELVMVYGTAQYTSAAKAGEEASPSTLPNRLQVHGVLAARFIFQKLAGTASEILSAFDTPFAVLGVTDHGNLAGLGGDDHTQYALHSILTTTGDIFIASSNGVAGRLAVGGANQIIGVSAGKPAWTDQSYISHDSISDVSADDHHNEAHALLSTPHSDTLAAGVTDGSIVIGNVTPAWSELVISVPAANVRNVLGIDNGEARPSWKTALDGTNPAVIGSLAPGTSLVFSHRDHVHSADHGAVGGLSDDDHSIYALLAGRSTGQTLIGGTASGEDLTLQSTANATRGSVFLGSSSKFELVETSGQLKLPTTGSGGGTLWGGDAQIYRSAENVLRTPDSMIIDGTLTVTGTTTLEELISTKSTLTIDANDEITVPTTAWLYVTSAGASDNLDGIGEGTEGQIVFLTPVAGKDITLIHNGTVTAGKPLMINGEANVTLDEDHDMAIAIYDATATVWNVMVAGAGGGGGHGSSASISDHTDVAAITEARGMFLRVNSTPAWEGLAAETAGALVGGDGTDVVSTVPKRTILLTAAGGQPSTTTPCADATVVEAGANDVDYWVLDFDASADEYAFWGPIPMPANYDGGVMTAIFYWTTTASDTDGVAWAIQMISLDDSDVIDRTWSTPVVVTDDVQGVAGDVLVTAASGDITPSGTASAPEMLFVRVFRDVSDANDDMAEDARLLAVKLLYTTNAISD